jgi:acyl-CoA synthetase (NDP forming)
VTDPAAGSADAGAAHRAADDAVAASVRAMLEARTVAVVGASERPGSFGHRLVTEVTRSAGRVEVVLVNPRYRTVAGRPCVGSLDDIDGPVDLVLLGIPDTAVEDEVRRAAARGDRSAVLFGSLFGDDPSATTARRQRVARVAGDAGMAVCGGGCMGFVNVTTGLRAIGYIERDELPRGPVAFITHSGSVFSAMLRTRRHLGFTVAVSSGQELVTTTGSYLQYALDHEGTKVVGLLLETLREPERLRAALERAARQDVTVVALTVGRSAAGQAMVAAHSGALAGADGAWEALFAAYGVIRVGNLDEMADTLELFAAGRRTRPTKAPPGIASVHDSGAERALVVDMAADVGLSFAVLADATRERLAAVLDPGLVPDNPLDVWGTGAETERLFGQCLEALAADGGVSAVALAVDLVAEYDGDESYPEAVLAAARSTDKPVVVLANLGSAIDEQAASRVRAGGVPVLEGTGSGLRALRHLLDRPTGRPWPAPVPIVVDEVRRRRWQVRLAAGPVDAAAAFALVADYGVPVVGLRPATSAAEARAAADGLGYPVVMKTDEPAIAHKSDVGGVVLGLDHGDAVDAAYRDLAGRLGPRVTLSATADDGVELALGLVHDPHLGPLVVIGAGGVLVEIMADAVVRLPPVDETGALEALERLRLSPLLDGVRGGPPVDRTAVARAVVALSALALELDGQLAALDINPLRCGPRGCLALDVLVEPRAETTA